MWILYQKGWIKKGDPLLSITKCKPALWIVFKEFHFTYLSKKNFSSKMLVICLFFTHAHIFLLLVILHQIYSELPVSTVCCVILNSKATNMAESARSTLITSITVTKNTNPLHLRIRYDQPTDKPTNQPTYL